jgi:beta-N-acetylhexosaminidase
MNIKLLVSLIIIATIIFSTVLYRTYSSEKIEISSIKQDVSHTTVIPVNRISEKLLTMSIDEKIGQLLIVGFEHAYVDDHIKKMISEYHISGINLLGRNIRDRSQTVKLMEALQALASTTLFLATDQEGGSVSRFKFLKELTAEPKIKDMTHAYEVARTRGQELKDLGINMNFAPVLDYVSDPNSYLYMRTFATTSDAIGELGNAMIDGYKKAGVVPVAKHFPGYGNIKPDPHKNGAVVNITTEEFEKFLKPFEVAIKEGEVGAIMTAHIIIPSIDDKPATISSKFLTEILRNRLGFEGVIITDDIEMISAGASVEQIAIASIEAGADMIISTYTPRKQILIFDAIKSAIHEGRISMERIDQSVYRILSLKYSLK